eukprot:6236199-Prymnesium_polylepis.2
MEPHVNGPHLRPGWLLLGSGRGRCTHRQRSGGLEWRDLARRQVAARSSGGVRDCRPAPLPGAATAGRLAFLAQEPLKHVLVARHTKVWDAIASAEDEPC